MQITKNINGWWQMKTIDRLVQNMEFCFHVITAVYRSSGTFVNLIIKRLTEIRAVKRIFQRRMSKGGKFVKKL